MLLSAVGQLNRPKLPDIPGCDGGLEAMRIDPAWEHQERSTSAMNEATRVAFTQYLEEQVGDDPELLGKVVPDYVCLGKRTLQDNGSWLAALERDDVSLVTDPISRITEDSVVCESGRTEIECKRSVHDAYDERLQQALAGMVWSHPSIQNSWYRKRAGRVTVLSPWRLVDCWSRTRRPDLDDFNLA